MFLIYNIAFSQTVAINEDNAIMKVSEKEYQVSITVTPKKATTLLVENIKSRQETVIEIDSSFNIHVNYAERTYTVTYTGQEKPAEFSKVSDTRKYVLNIIREQLNIT